jgi:hypothetical protein
MMFMNGQKLQRCAAWTLICLAAGGLGLNGNQAVAAEGTWLTGAALHEALGQSMGLTWSNITVRQALASLSKTQRLAVMLDRRVDPDQKIELAFDHVPLQEALARIASRLQIGVTMLGPVAYFGPVSTVQRLRTVVALRNEEASRLPIAVRMRWTQAKPLKWEKLSSPRDLLADLGRQQGLELQGLEQIPADLWAAADLPPLTLPERLMIVLGQFDLTYQPATDGSSLRIVAMPTKPIIERSYAVKMPQDVAAQLRQMKLLTDAEIEVAGSQLIVRGRQEDQDVVSEVLAGHTAHRISVAEGRKVYTLRVELPVGQLVNALGKQMGMEIQLDRPAIAAAGISLEKTVQVDVKDASSDELLQAVLKPAGLKYVQHDNTIEITPR